MAKETLFVQYQYETDSPLKTVVNKHKLLCKAFMVILGRINFPQFARGWKCHSSCKSIIYDAYMLKRFICVSGIRPTPQVIDKISKDSFYLLPKPLRFG